MIGNAGLTESVMKEISESLKRHELIKIRVMGDDRALRETMLDKICTELNAAPIQHIGKILVIYQPNPDAHLIEIKKMPRHKGKKPLTKKQLGSRS
jgi:RNA-binding protein